MGEEGKPAAEVEVLDEKQDKAAVPAEVVDIFGRLGRALKDAPWVGLGAMFTVIGFSILYWYFRSIDYLPPDLAAVIAPSAVVAGFALAFILLFLVSWVIPRWAYQNAAFFFPASTPDSSNGAKGVHWLLVNLQFVGVGLLLLYLTYRLASKCIPGAAYFGWAGVALLGFGSAGWAYIELNGARFPSARWKRGVHGLGVALWSLIPFWVLYSFLVPDQGIEWWHLATFLAIWVVVVLFSALGSDSIPLWGLALLGLFALPLLVFHVPYLLYGQPSLFSTRVAELAGIRNRKPSEMRIPRSTCALIQSALADGQTSADLTCDSASEWGSVKAQVLSNLGDRWLIEVPVDAGDKTGGGGSLRITIPGKGVQTVWRTLPKAESAASCSLWPWGKSQTTSAL